MKPLFLFIFFTVSFCLSAQDKSLPIIRGSISSMGSDSLFNSLSSLRYTAKGHEFAIEQSERPEGPFVVSYFTLQVEKSLRQPKCLYSIKYAANVRPYQVFVDGNRVGALAGKMWLPMYPETDEQVDLAPEKVLFTALRSSPRYIKDTIMHGMVQHVVAFNWKNIPVRLFISKATTMLTGVEVTRYYVSNFNYVWGDVKRLTLYSFWHLEKNGLHYPFQADVFVNERHFRSVTIDSLQFNLAVAADTMQINDSAFMRMQVMQKMIDPLEKPKLQPKEIASGIFFIPGNWNASYVTTANGIYILEAPISSVYSKAVLEQVTNAQPSQKILGVISTSDAWPHIGGLREYAARKIPIHLLDLNQPIATALLRGDHRTHPDSLSRNRQRPDIKIISNKTTIGAGTNRMELYPMRTESGERMMFVYFPEKKLLYTSDMVQPDSRGGFFMKQYLSEVNHVIVRERLEVENIFGMHLPLTPYSRVLKALQ